MKFVADIVMILWIPLVLVMFAALPARRAVLSAYIGGWLFLPTLTYQLPGLPDYSKATAISIAVALGIMIFDIASFRRLRWRWFDAPATIVCLTPFVSSIGNGLGAWDGVAGIVDQFSIWGTPYLVGRVYFLSENAMHELAIGVVAGGVLYAPLCWLENRLGPQIANLVYGVDGKWTNAMRFGGWRPSVFMTDGLMAAMWMTIAALVAVRLWRSKGLPQYANIAPGLVAAILVGTAILTRSTGALSLLAVGIASIGSLRLHSRVALILLLLAAPAYLVARIGGFWDGAMAVEIAAKLDRERAESLQFRMTNEDLLIDKAIQQPFFGWGGWGRSRVYDADGKDVSVTDGQWIIEFGTRGLTGLAALYAMLLLPLYLMLRKFSAFELALPSKASPLVLAVGVALFAIDCIPNGMINPVFALMSGAVVGWATTAVPTRDAYAVNSATRSKARHVSTARRLHPGYA